MHEDEATRANTPVYGGHKIQGNRSTMFICSYSVATLIYITRWLQRVDIHFIVYYSLQ